MDRQFAARTAVVTGAGSGIGRATALRLSRTGAQVICLDRDSAGLDETMSLLKEPGHAAVADVTSEDAVRAAVEDAVAVMAKPPSIVANVAGINFSKPILDFTAADFDALMRTNVGSILAVTKAVSPYLAAGSVVVNTASASGASVFPGTGLYGASKAAVVYLTRAMALELAPRGIRVCAVGPGGVDTPMGRRELPSDPEAAAAILGSVQWIKRLGHADEIAAAICYLASDDAAFITGSTLWIDGGMTSR